MSEILPKYILADMISCINRIISYTQDSDIEAFMNDEKTIDAVIRNLEVMGEAANRLPNSFIMQYEDVPWQLIISTRNRLIHGYDTIDYKVVWRIATTNIPSLRTQILSILNSL